MFARPLRLKLCGNLMWMCVELLIGTARAADDLIHVKNEELKIKRRLSLKTSFHRLLGD